MRQYAPRKWLLAAMLGGMLATGTAPGAPPAMMPVEKLSLSEIEQTLLQENPVLAELAAKAPDLLREILDKLASINDSAGNTRGGLEQIDEETARILTHNPALLQAWRNSPEASADLLQLIRVAAGNGKPRK